MTDVESQPVKMIDIPEYKQQQQEETDALGLRKGSSAIPVRHQYGTSLSHRLTRISSTTVQYTRATCSTRVMVALVQAFAAQNTTAEQPRIVF